MKEDGISAIAPLRCVDLTAIFLGTKQQKAEETRQLPQQNCLPESNQLIAQFDGKLYRFQLIKRMAKSDK